MAEETTQSQLPVLTRVSCTTPGKQNGMHLHSATINTTVLVGECHQGMMIDIIGMMTDMNAEEVKIMEDNQLRPT